MSHEVNSFGSHYKVSNYILLAEWIATIIASYDSVLHTHRPRLPLDWSQMSQSIQYLLELLHGQRYTIQVVHKEQYQPVRMHSYPS